MIRQLSLTSHGARLHEVERVMFSCRLPLHKYCRFTPAFRAIDYFMAIPCGRAPAGYVCLNALLKSRSKRGSSVRVSWVT